MCGIYGALGWDVGEEAGLRALRTLSHRGPDGEGHVVLPGERGFLGHRRLSIIDLSDDGRQPMTNEDGDVHLTFNGEIYNYQELRAELVTRGHTFTSRCDAEVVLHLYEEEGACLLERLSGMFAFAIYDERTDEVLLARDRLGIKPLHYYEDGTRLVFASELKAIRATPGLDLQPDPTAYYDFLTYEFVPAPKTIYRKVAKLPAAHCMTWRAGQPRVARYWRPDERAAEGTEQELLDRFDALVPQAVESHMLSDVPVGVFLSAGVDSTLVACLARERSEEPLQAFTVGFAGRDDDEADEAAEIAASLGALHRIQRFGPDELARDIERMPALFDEPFADASALPMIELSRLASRHVKVVLSGDGGDETHAGYGRYLKRARKQALYAFARGVPGLASLTRLGPLATLPWARAVREESLGRPYSFHLGIPRQAKRLLLDGASGLFDDYDDYWAIREHAPRLGSLRGQQEMDLATHLPEGILTKVDRTSMAFGLEVRPPLLDHRLVEFALTLPESMKVSGDVQKLFLRRLLGRHLPPSVAHAKKRAFSVPMKRYVAEGRVGPRGDVDVLGAFRVRKDRLERYFKRSGDAQVHWILHVLEGFLRHEAEA